MDWDKLENNIQRSPRYIFFQKHRQLFIFIEGLIVIGLLIGIVCFFIQDREIKEQIRDRCGYTNDKYDCICDANYVKDWKMLRNNEEILFENITEVGEG